MTHHLERAKRELKRECRLAMDLAGPKLRTGPIEPGPTVLKVKPRRDPYGRVTKTAVVALVPVSKLRAPGVRLTRSCRLMAIRPLQWPSETRWRSRTRAGGRVA